MRPLPSSWKRFFCAGIVVVALAALGVCTVLRSTPARADFSRRLDARLLRTPLTGDAARRSLAGTLKALKQMDPAVKDVPGNWYLDHLDLEQLAQAPVKQNQDGTCSVDRFWINLKEKTYAFEFGGKCRYHYSGSFDWVQGKWQATTPSWDWIACSR